jgi:prefoldin alpha subunit
MEKATKVEKFEKFVNEKLRTDLSLVLETQSKINEEISEYIQVKDTISKLDTLQIEEFKSRIDLGCNFYANALVENKTRTIFLAIGYGFFLEMNFEQALAFIEKKVKLLTDEANVLTEKAAEIKANIKLVLEGLKEMQSLQFAENKFDEKKSLFF